MNYYIPSHDKGLKGIIYNRTKNKLQQHFVTHSFAQALCCLGVLPYAFFDFGTGDVPVLCEAWAGFCRDLYRGRSGCIYTVEVLENVKTGENLNGGYKSEKPYRVTGCTEIADVYAEIMQQEKDGKLQILRYDEQSEEQKNRVMLLAERYVKRYNLRVKTTEYTGILRVKMPGLFTEKEGE